VAERQPLDTSLVSLLLDPSDQANANAAQAKEGPANEVRTVTLGRVQGAEILDTRGANDLRFFLRTALSQENYRQVTIRLTPGMHDLSVSYIAPAPTWRVSYRLVTQPKAKDGPRALLQGWGILDNRLEEDLKDVSLSLVAGMPISFVYDLYTPFTPERPVVKEQARVAAAPVEFEEAAKAPGMAVSRGAAMADMAPMKMRAPAPAAAPRRARVSAEALEAAAPVTTEGESLGELFQYVIGTPVTVGRGQSAMVPIVSSWLDYRKDLLYNGAKMPAHPVATLRLNNATGLTLERGPVTVLEDGEYVGEAVLPFTVGGGEVVVPYAVELGVNVQERDGSRREMHALHLKGAYLHIEEWDIRWHEYQLNNRTADEITVLVEHPRTSGYDLFDSAEPRERTDSYWRFEVTVPAREERVLKVQARHLIRRREQVRQQSYKALQGYLKQGLIDRRTHDLVAELLELWQKVAETERRIERIGKKRNKIYKAQEQIQGNMKALSNEGKEGTLRAQYVDQLAASEKELDTLQQQESTLEAEIERLKSKIEAKLEAAG
jgi:hypothetical protein